MFSFSTKKKSWWLPELMSPWLPPDPTFYYSFFHPKRTIFFMSEINIYQALLKVVEFLGKNAPSHMHGVVWLFSIDPCTKRSLV